MLFICLKYFSTHHKRHGLGSRHTWMESQTCALLLCELSFLLCEVRTLLAPKTLLRSKQAVFVKGLAHSRVTWPAVLAVGRISQNERTEKGQSTASDKVWKRFTCPKVRLAFNDS